MTSISAASTGSYLSPLDFLKQELQSEVASGKVSSADQDALSSALDDIDSALTSQRQADSGGKPPGDLQSRIDDLIAGEVSSGKLTSDQASELKTVFANAFANGGPGGAGGPPPSDPSGSDSSSATDGTSSTSGTEELLKKLLEALQDSLSQSSSYGAGGGGNSSSPTSLLVDFRS